MTRQPPLLRRGGLDPSRVWLVLRYKARPDVGDGHVIEALEKVDVTEEFEALLEDRQR